VQVRLEDGDEPPAGVCLPRRFERCGELRRMVRVVVHHFHTSLLPQPLEAPPDTAELREPREHRLERSPDRYRGAECRNGVAQVVHARNLQAERYRAVAGHADTGHRSFRLRDDVPDRKVATLDSKPPGLRTEALREPARARIVDPDDYPIRPGGKGVECVFQRLEAAIALEVVR